MAEGDRWRVAGGSEAARPPRRSVDGAPAEGARGEMRWPVALAILAVLVLLAVLPDRVRMFPIWLPFAVGGVVLAPMIAVGLSGGKERWLRLERAVTLVYVVAAESGALIGLGYLTRAMVHRPAEIGGLQLLTSSIGVWVTNVLAFSLLYWQIDRGGPASRAHRAAARPDWVFPEEGEPRQVPGWRPAFVDYLFLAFTTATAFSPTDALPLTPRAKLMMMVEGAISLVTIVIVASRAINILGN